MQLWFQSSAGLHVYILVQKSRLMNLTTFIYFFVFLTPNIYIVSPLMTGFYVSALLLSMLCHLVLDLHGQSHLMYPQPLIFAIANQCRWEGAHFRLLTIVDGRKACNTFDISNSGRYSLFYQQFCVTPGGRYRRIIL